MVSITGAAYRQCVAPYCAPPYGADYRCGLHAMRDTALHSTRACSKHSAQPYDCLLAGNSSHENKASLDCRGGLRCRAPTFLAVVLPYNALLLNIKGTIATLLRVAGSSILAGYLSVINGTCGRLFQGQHGSATDCRDDKKARALCATEPGPSFCQVARTAAQPTCRWILPRQQSPLRLREEP